MNLHDPLFGETTDYTAPWGQLDMAHTCTCTDGEELPVDPYLTGF